MIDLIGYKKQYKTENNVAKLCKYNRIIGRVTHKKKNMGKDHKGSTSSQNNPDKGKGDKCY